MEESIRILNDLIRVSEDGKKGFTESAERAEDLELKTLFTERAAGCAEAGRELQQLVQTLGGKPAGDEGSVAGAAHRGWVKLKSVVGDKDVNVLEEVERGEDYAKAQYMKALKADLLPSVRGIVERQYRGVIANHDRVKELRERFRATA
ncbi:MAG TPA: PA2169 family four-helix-bundle protein [Candidatus Binatia bacterium]|nr:PA2169 family four-helix-bundle protein [Candidatus Binatia bacterium]